MITLKKVKELLEKNEYNFENLKEYIDFDDVFYNWKEFKDTEDFENEVTENFINYIEAFIYYADAIKFLQENDPSFQQSLEAAHDMGYSCDNLNSSILANLLLQSYLQKEFIKLLNMIEDDD